MWWRSSYAVAEWGRQGEREVVFDPKKCFFLLQQGRGVDELLTTWTTFGIYELISLGIWGGRVGLASMADGRFWQALIICESTSIGISGGKLRYAYGEASTGVSTTSANFTRLQVNRYQH
jgi:hypothetical protein